MNDIIKNIEAAQLKAEVPAFSVGDTVKVSSKVTMKVSSITVKETPIELDKFVIELSNKASMPKIKGDEFRIDTADKDDLEDELKDLSSELSGALSNSSLLNTFKNLF